MNSLKVEGLRKRIGSFDLIGDFEVKPGQRLALSGPSGSGKTSLLRWIAGLDLLAGGDSGKLLLGDRDLTRVPAEKRGMGVVFQEQELFPSMSVMENAAFALRMRRVPREERESLVMPWLEKVGLRDLADASVQKLSGGERQRVAFVRAIVWKPEVLLLDEPFSALDPSLREGIRKSLVELHSLWPVPMILVTHDEADIRAVATAEMRIDLSDPKIRKLSLG